jgi:SH3 domain protein
MVADAQLTFPLDLTQKLIYLLSNINYLGSFVKLSVGRTRRSEKGGILMKRLAMGVLIGAIGLVSVAAAETAYVTDIIKLAVRSGPGNDQKSIGMLESGQMVEIVKPGDEWTQVRMANGTEGYVMSRYLVSQQPAKFRADQLQEKNKALVAQVASLMEENSRLKAENEKLAAASSASQKEIGSLRSEFEAFKTEAADVTALKAKYDAQAAELAEKRAKIAQLETQWSDILDPNNLYWFLAGAGVLLAGFFTGYSVKRQRRWSSLS